jgi:hypothetical protein
MEIAPGTPYSRHAQFWIGFIQYLKEDYWSAVNTFYLQVVSSPGDDPHVPLGLFFQGLSFENLGYCGYATRDFEAVVQGEFELDPQWVAAAANELANMQNDDGAICDNWD